MNWIPYADILAAILALATAFVSIKLYKTLRDKKCLCIAAGFIWATLIRFAVLAVNMGLVSIADPTIRAMPLPAYIMWFIGMMGLLNCVTKYLHR